MNGPEVGEHTDVEDRMDAYLNGINDIFLWRTSVMVPLPKDTSIKGTQMRKP